MVWLASDRSHNLNSLKEGYGTIMGGITGDTSSLDYGSCKQF